MMGEQAEAPQANPDAMSRAIELFDRARSVWFLTGAGVSAESGIPTFRDKGGLWEGNDPRDLATREAFRRNPGLVTRFYHRRRTQVAHCDPNPAHDAIASLQCTHNAALVTQNVDGLHQRAGSEDVIELHGTLWQDRCDECGKAVAVSPSEYVEENSMGPAACIECGGLMRPAVVWFGEALPAEPLRRVDELVKTRDVLVIVGTSLTVYPAAGFAEIAKRYHTRIIEMNIEPTPLTPLADVVIQGPAGLILPAWAERLAAGRGGRR